MKHLKTFESNSQYNVDDYVLINYNTKHKALLKLKNFVDNTIGKIVFMNDTSVIVQYSNIPDKLKHFFDDKIVDNNKIKNSVFFWKNEITIKRLATEGEIEKYKLNVITKKFNI